ncbi:hypothetical protein [Microbacterium halotolerans]|uniref:hypothetical protein n=1 Tax=Microbacterium halotolerans TaxID=246613 RepID=UPI000E6AC651|nr:hypothetical protein [Microbacterium halotolerans]
MAETDGLRAAMIAGDVSSPDTALSTVELPVIREETTWVFGAAMPPAWRLAVWQGPGATLWWDVAAPETDLGIVVTDATSALPWISEVFGDAVSRLLRSPDDPSAEALAFVRQTPLATAARDVALARWRQAWWPASREKLVPPLDPRLLAAERADALDRLREGATSVALADTAALDSARHDLAAAERRFGRLDDHDSHPHRSIGAVTTGAEPAPVDASPSDAGVVPSTGDLALHRAPERRRAPLSGTFPIDVSLIPHGVVDAAAEARWHIAFQGAVPWINLEILAAPRFANEAPPEPDLHVSFAEINAELTLTDGAWRAEQPVPLHVLTDPPSDSTLVLYLPGRETRRPAPDAAELIRIARERLVAPTSPSEGEAASRAIV